MGVFPVAAATGYELFTSLAGHHAFARMDGGIRDFDPLAHTILNPEVKPQMPNFLEDIRWKSLCPGLLLVDSLRLAFRVRVLLLAIIALLLVVAADSLTLQLVPSRPWEASVISSWLAPDFGSDVNTISDFHARVKEGLLLPWRNFLVPIIGVHSDAWYFGQKLAFLFLFVWQLAVWAAFGGAICRVAALALTRKETPDLPHALGFAKRNYGTFLSAPLTTLAAVLLLSLPLVALGFIMRVGWLAFVAALFWPLVLLIGLGLALLTIGLALGFPLMWAAVAVEETDAFDAISRAYSYLFQRPLRLLWYILVAAVLGWLGGVAIEFILIATRAMAERTVALGHGTVSIVPDSDPSDWERIVQFWTGGLSVVRAAYYYSYFWCAAVGIYLLMRRDIDSVQLDEVAVEPLEPYAPNGLVARGATAESQSASS